MTGELIEKKLANALFERAEVTPGSGAFKLSIALVRRAYGGLWVGGNIFLYRDKLRFAPNALNRSLHKEGSVGAIEITLSAVTGVERRFGILSGIIRVTYGDKLFIFRCFGAKGFAQAILAALPNSNSN
jgi:hypothetical protein